jgi:beta-phosphoglucomutase
MAIRAFIFDLDGVITDTAEFHYLAWDRLSKEEGIPFTREDNEKLRGLSRRDSLLTMLKGRVVPEETMEAWMTRKNIYYREYLSRITPNDRLPGVTEFLEEAQAAGIKLGVGSASRNARDVLEKLGLLDMFQVVGDGLSVVNTKPHPDIFIWTAGGLGVSVTEAVVFEDAEAGIDAALKAGFKAVGLGSSNVGHAHLVFPGLANVRVSDVLNGLEVARSTPA